MSLQRPLVSVYNSESENEEVKSNVALPDVFNAPIRVDIVRVIHSGVIKNGRQPYAVNRWAGMQTAAESWGTGRAVSRIPRVPGGGTHRAGQGAFGNMCRGGRMFAPTKVWRRWAHKISKGSKRFATCSALAASSELSLLKARGHIVDNIPELPLVVTDDIEKYVRTRQAVAFLKRVGAWDDVEKSINSRKIRTGKGKARDRRRVTKIGPLVIFKNNNGLVKAFHNIPGVKLQQVDQMNIRDLAPGAQVGRFIIWTESAFKSLNSRFGSYGAKGAVSQFKTRAGQVYKLPNPVMQNTDLTSLIMSDAIQNVVREKRIQKKVVSKKTKYKLQRISHRLNPLLKQNLTKK